MALPNASIEQKTVITALKDNNNVIVDSVAGSGKTTCILHIVQELKDKQILLLTYNSKLRLETRQKAKKLKLSNIEIHTYHSFAYKYYNACKNDLELNNILVKEKESKIKMNFDILILDETQDMTLLYYKLVCRLISDSLKIPQICILGDRYQSIYDFNKADNRFIILGHKLFNFSKETSNESISNWSFLNLSETFRCTIEMTTFVNKCMLGYDRLISNKNNSLPRYVYCDIYGDDGTLYSPFDELVYYLKAGYKPEEIFIIAPSVRSEKTPIRSLENKIKQKLPHVPIYVPISDDEKIDEDILKNKLVFSTFHQVKGLERKVVLVFGFDISYFVFYKKDITPHICPNELYVASTRASERITLFHDRACAHLPFLNISKIPECCTIIGSTGTRKEFKREEILQPIGVVDLLRFCTFDILQECCKFFNVNKIRDIGEFIDIPCKIKQSTIGLDDEIIETYENVSDITGISIPTYFEMISNKKCSIAENLLSINRIGKKLYLEVLEKLEDTSPDKLLTICNYWNALTTGYKFKLDQIKDYNWLSQELLNKCMDRFKTLGISNKAKFEFEIKYNKDLIKHSEIRGFIDCIDLEGKNLWEFKCVQEIKDEHFIQLAIYKLIYGVMYPDVIFNSYLYNILSDEMYIIDADNDSLKRMLKILENNKNAHITKDSDETFVKKTLEHRDKMMVRREKYKYSLVGCNDNLFIDLETDGKTIVQISYILTDEKYNVIKEFDRIINTGTIISDFSTSIHKISTEISRTKGVLFISILNEIKDDFINVKTIYAHNAAFDIGVLKHNLEEFERYDIFDLIDSKNIVCTMKTFKEYVDAKDINGRTKVPKLEEFYFKVFSKEIQKNLQHNSLHDTRFLYNAVKETYNTGLLDKLINSMKDEECLLENNESIDPYKRMTMDQLTKICKENGLKGYSSLKKEQLIDKIKNNKEEKIGTLDSFFTKNLIKSIYLQ